MINGDIIKGILLMFGLSMVMSIGIKWILVIIVIPLLLLFTFLGINIDSDPDVLSARFSILSFFLALGYLLFGNKFIKMTKK